MPETSPVGVIGARSLVGECLLAQFHSSGQQVTAFSRNPHPESGETDISWQILSADLAGSLPVMVSAAPVWVLPDYFPLFEALGVRHLVALSSTSRFTKTASSSRHEQDVVQKIITTEDLLVRWAGIHGVSLAILRPTLIYGYGKDRNITEIQRFIRRFGFFPVFGAARGLRQPIHARDVAAACIAALAVESEGPFVCNIGGGETLEYRAMIERVFQAMGMVPRLVPVPLGLFRLAVSCLRVFPRYRNWTGDMAERMNRDMVFASEQQQARLKCTPGAFRPD